MPTSPSDVDQEFDRVDLDQDGDVGVAGRVEKPKERLLRLRDGRKIRLTDVQAKQIDALCDRLHELGHGGWDEPRAGELLHGCMWDSRRALNGALLLSLPDSATRLEDRKLAQCFHKLHRTS